MSNVGVHYKTHSFISSSMKTLHKIQLPRGVNCDWPLRFTRPMVNAVKCSDNNMNHATSSNRSCYHETCLRCFALAGDACDRTLDREVCLLRGGLTYTSVSNTCGQPRVKAPIRWSHEMNFLRNLKLLFLKMLKVASVLYYSYGFLEKKAETVFLCRLCYRFNWLNLMSFSCYETMMFPFRLRTAPAQLVCKHM